MTTPTPKLALDLVDPAVFQALGVSKINANFADIDTFMGSVICTSTTRPSTPFPGMTIYETDTKLLRVRNQANNSWLIVNQLMGVNATSEIISPQDGDIVFVKSERLFYFHDGTIWRKLFPVSYAAQSQLTSGTLGPSGSVTIFQQTVSYPGYDYWIEANGQVGWAMSAASQLDKLIRLSITIDTTLPDTNRISTGYGLSRSIGAGFTQESVSLAPKNSSSFGAFTNNKVVRLMVTNMSDANMTLPAAAVDSFFNVRVIRPA